MARANPVSWLRERPAIGDAALAALLAAVALTFHLTMHEEDASDPSVLGALLAVGATLPVAWRRRGPAVVLVVVTAFQMAMELLNAIGAGWIGVLVAAYTLGAYRSTQAYRRFAVAMAVVVIGFVLVGVVFAYTQWQALVEMPVVFISSMVLGDNVRRRRERNAELVERAERAERERSLVAGQQVLAERARIARELHDVVAHNVSLMVIQAGAARRLLGIDRADIDRADSDRADIDRAGSDRIKADVALAVVEDTGRAAMQEMRRMLGVLRADADQPVLAPQPGLAAIESLAAASPDLPVSVEVSGELGDVPSGLALNAYRIVQEALTNVRRHGGVVHRVKVSVVRANGSLTVEVDDDGRGAATTPSINEGFGIVGMRERVAAFDGRLSAGPRVGGGWRVRAVFPVPAE
jgi:signal transduction histidine kinase